MARVIEDNIKTHNTVSCPLTNKLFDVSGELVVSVHVNKRGIEMRLIINGTEHARVDQTLLKNIVRAHKWLNDLATGRMQNMAEIASREGVDKSYVSRVVNLAFLAPDIIESNIAWHQPADLNVEKLTKRTDLPLDWAQQHQLLGL
jgi:site-specific DNA recombinase